MESGNHACSNQNQASFRIASRSPCHFSLPAPSPDLALFSEAEQSLQGQFDGFALGFQAGCAKRIPHQLIVDHDIGSHDVYSMRVLYTL